MTEKSKPRRQEEKHEDWRAPVRRIRFLMDTSHITMQDLAVELGMRKSDLLEILDGLAQPSTHFIRETARHFGVTIEFLMSGKELGEKGATPAAAPVAAHAPAKAKRKPVRTGGGAFVLKDLAIRHQALLELLVQKGTITAGEYKAVVEQIKFRRS